MRVSGWRWVEVFVVSMVLAGMTPAGPFGMAWAQSRDLPRLEKQIDALSRAGRYTEATPLAELALKTLETKFGPGHGSTGDALFILANLYKNQGRLADAEPLYKRSIPIIEKSLGSQHPHVAGILYNLANLYKDQGRFAEAEAIHKRSLAIRETSSGKAPLDLAESLNSLAALYKTQGRLGEAEPMFQRGRALAEKAVGAEHRVVAGILNNLANLYMDQARLTDAETLLRRGLAINEKVLGPGHVTVAASLQNLAILFVGQGRYPDAEPLYKRSLAITESVLGAEHPSLANTLDSLATLYAYQGRVADAEPLNKRSLAIREKTLGADHPAVAASLNNLANLYHRDGRYEQAEPLQKRSLVLKEKAFGADHPDVALSLNNLAFLYQSQGRFAEAAPLNARAYAIRVQAYGPAHPRVGESLGSIGRLDVALKRWGPAIESLRRSAAIQATQDRSAARELRNASDDRRSGKFVFGELTSAAWNLAGEQPSQRPSLGLETFEAAQLAERQAAGLALAQMSARIGTGTAGVARLVREQQDLSTQRDTLDKTLIAALSEPLGRRNEAHIAQLRRTADTAEVRFKALTAEIGRAFPAYAELASPKPMTVPEVQRLLNPDEALMAYLVRSDDETFVWAVTREAVRWQWISVGEKTLADKIAALRTGLDADDLSKAAAAGKLFDLGLAHELHDLLLGPVADLLKGKRQLIVVPSGPLTSLPFHLLVTDKPVTAKPSGQQLDAYRKAAWLIREQAVTVLPSVGSLRALRVLAKGGQGTQPLVGFGDPVFGAPTAAQSPTAPATRTAGAPPPARTRAFANSYASVWRGGTADLASLRMGLAALPETAGELQAVAAAVGAPTNDLHLGAAASEATVKRLDLSPYRIVYFATHGLIAGEIKGLGEPALALTLPATASALDDGLLTASEVAQLKLNADWVVLSACNTASGDAPGAEALSGLARAFFYAGARALLVSHWRVDSQAAVRLTTTTFAALQKEPALGRAEALRRAMLAYIDDGSSPWNAYPDYWAPFSVIGEGGR